MRRYAALRLLGVVAVIWAAYTITFVILYVIPGDPIQILLGNGIEGYGGSPEQVAKLRHDYGLDMSLTGQYFHQMNRILLHGDFGTSYLTTQDVSAMIGHALPSTIQLTAAALFLGIVFGVAIAVAGVYVRWGWFQTLMTSFPALGVSIPTFWVGLLLLEWFSFKLQIVPATGTAGIQTLILPAITLAIPTAAVIAQVLGRSLRDNLHEPYIDIVRSKGASRARVQLLHALPNALLPTITVIGSLVGLLIGGAVITETIFARNGIGQLLAHAVTTKDTPVVQGIVILTATVFVLVNLVVDLIYPLLDPRVKLTRTAA
jgi:peptide/nickel transport system permease protein